MNAPVDLDAAAHAMSLPLDMIDVSDPKLYQRDEYFPYFARLRREEIGRAHV
mgnify:CR=1 FL=1